MQWAAKKISEFFWDNVSGESTRHRNRLRGLNPKGQSYLFTTTLLPLVLPSLRIMLT